jgi:solute carrier family 25 protein 33/36
LIAGFTAVSITNPIWFVKTRLQLDETRRGKTALEVINKIFKQNGILGFYKGISASYFGVAESAIYFVLYEKLKKLSADHTNHALLAYFTSAGFAKTLASCLCYPHEVARTRLREEGNKYTGFFQTLSLVVKEEGMRGLYKGMGTHLIRQIPNTAIVMTTYELIVNHFSVDKNNNQYEIESNQDE